MRRELTRNLPPDRCSAIILATLGFSATIRTWEDRGGRDKEDREDKSYSGK